MTWRLANAFVVVCLVACGRSSAPPPQPAKPSATGIWLGTLHAGTASLRLQLRLDLSQTPNCSLDSLDQHAGGIACTATLTGTALKVDVPAVKGTMEVTLSADGNTLAGTWTQGGPLPLTLTRQTSAIEATPPATQDDPVLARAVEILHNQIAGNSGV